MTVMFVITIIKPGGKVALRLAHYVNLWQGGTFDILQPSHKQVTNCSQLQKTRLFQRCDKLVTNLLLAY